jgi:hypothetical protein
MPEVSFVSRIILLAECDSGSYALPHLWEIAKGEWLCCRSLPDDASNASETGNRVQAGITQECHWQAVLVPSRDPEKGLHPIKSRYMGGMAASKSLPPNQYLILNYRSLHYTSKKSRMDGILSFTTE